MTIGLRRLTVAVAAVSAFGPSQVALAGKAHVKHQTVAIAVKATILPTRVGALQGVIRFSRKTVKRGPVIFTILNRDNNIHLVEINGVTSRWIGANKGKAILRVTFSKPGVYSAGCPDARPGITGQIRVT